MIKKSNGSVSKNLKLKFVFCVFKLKLKNRLRKVNALVIFWTVLTLENQATGPEDSTSRFWRSGRYGRT
jgi:hypothetical protein